MDSISYWNDVALEANRASHSNGKQEQTGPTLSSRALAIVHLAMYDALAGVTNTPSTLPLYLPVAVLPPLPAGPLQPGAIDAAVAAAAHSTLSALFPSQRAFFDARLQSAGLTGTGLATGHAFGLGVAAALLTDRRDDDDGGSAGHCSSMNPGAHRPDPENPDAGILAWAEKYKYDLWRPVVGIREHDNSMGPAGSAGNNISNDCDPSWLPLGAPSTNSLDSTTMHTYPCQQMQREVVKNFTPPFPAYPSGHATFGAAAFHVTRRFYNVPDGDRSADLLFKDLEFTSEELNGLSQDNLGTVRPKHTRDFADGLWQMIVENGESRVFLGVHYVFDAFLRKADGSPDLAQNVGGVPLGLAIAETSSQRGTKRPLKSPRRYNGQVVVVAVAVATAITSGQLSASGCRRAPSASERRRPPCTRTARPGR